MPKAELELVGGEYATVAERIEAFYARFPEGRIITELVTRTEEEVTFRAKVYRASNDARPAATGWASEREGDGMVNEVACLENTETSAIGRALANLGFASSIRRPSAEEMAKAARVRERRALAVREAPAAPQTASHVSNRELEQVATQPAADALADVYRLLREAERAGMRPARIASLRRRLQTEPPLAEAAVQNLESALRDFLARRFAQRVGAALGAPDESHSRSVRLSVVDGG